jgi:hypothetical protein
VASLERQDVLVYAHPDGDTYVARIDGAWLRWPAEHHGWARRERCPESLADPTLRSGGTACWELEPRLGALALRLSGVEEAVWRR